MTTRRTFLEGMALGFASMSAGPAIGHAARLPDVGRKFSADGRVLPFAGNTIICHLPQQGEDSAMFDALLDIYRALPGEGWARKVTALPPSSWHMTIFGGANDKERRYPLWPAELPLGLPIAECDRILGERLRGFRLGEDTPPYRLRVDPADPPARETPLTLRLLPADDDTQVRLRRLRERLSALLGIRAPDQDIYRLHITLAYQFAALTPEEDAAWRRSLARWKAELAQRVPAIVLGPPEYCVLKDMFAFKRQFYLR